MKIYQDALTFLRDANSLVTVADTSNFLLNLGHDPGSIPAALREIVDFKYAQRDSDYMSIKPQGRAYLELLEKEAAREERENKRDEREAMRDAELKKENAKNWAVAKASLVLTILTLLATILANLDDILKGIRLIFSNSPN